METLDFTEERRLMKSHPTARVFGITRRPVVGIRAFRRSLIAVLVCVHMLGAGAQPVGAVTTLSPSATSAGGGGAPAACLPDAGACFLNNGTPGCSSPDCCAAICAADSFCCNTQWDQLCADAAVENPACTIRGCPGAGGCDVAHGNAGCADLACCNFVCFVEPACCSGEWDGLCAEIAVNSTRCGAAAAACCLPDGLCGTLGLGECMAFGGVWQGAGTSCGGGVICPNPACGRPDSGRCLARNFTPGCKDGACCSAVCALDAFCCSLEWDQGCAEIALTLAVCTPATTCVSTAGGCTTPGGTGTPGCSDASCCQAVCEFDAFCCTDVWDASCATLAQTTLACGFTGAACCFPNGTCIDVLGSLTCTSLGGVLFPAGTLCNSAMLCAPRCPWDCTPLPFGNGAVNIDDIVAVINDFGVPNSPCDSAPANPDGTFGNNAVNIDDLVASLNNFGDCAP
jgi:hypothetical protein